VQGTVDGIHHGNGDDEEDEEGEEGEDEEAK
jgi:hypothetical protein